jgi:hypothetical protein
MALLLLATTMQAQNYTITTTPTSIVITDVSGNGETLNISESGGNIRFVVTPNSRTYAINGGATTAFTTPANVALGGITSITVNTAAGTDIINISAFAASMPSLTINGGTGNDAVNFNGDLNFAADANLDMDLQNDDAPVGEDNVTVVANANLILSGVGTATVKVSRNVTINSGGSIETDDGNLTVEANQQAVPIAGGFIGIEVRGTLKVRDSGLLTLNGKGGNSNINNHGVSVRNGGNIEGGTAATSVQGTGGASIGNSNFGILVDGTNSKITSSGGNVSVTGTGGGSGSSGGNHGIGVFSTGQITAGGSGTVTVQGNGGTATMGNRNFGVLIAGAGTQIISSGGNVSVTGTGGGSGTSIDNHGIYVQSAGQITAGGDGTVTVVGNGGTAPTGLGNQGVYVEGIGTQITSSGGNVSITGMGGGSGSSRENYGVYIVSLGRITAGGNGTLTIVGTGGSSTSDRNYGVYVLAESQITSSGGNVSVTGVEGSGSSGIGFVSASSCQVTTVPNGGNITLIANSMSIAADVSTPSGNSVTLRPYTNGVQINLGSNADPIGGPIRLSDAELDRVTCGTLNIGNASTSDITVSTNITRPVSTVINLTTGGQVNLNASALNSAGGDVNINAPNGMNPTATGIDVNTGASSTFDFTAGNKLKIVINGTTVDAQYSQLRVVGKVDITDVNLEFGGSFIPSSCQSFMIVNNDGTDAIIGTFTGLVEGETLPNFRGSGLNAKISYIGGDGNDVVIRVIGVTPPSITCPANIVRSNDAGQCSAVVAYTTPTALDNCGLPIAPPQWISGGTTPTASGSNSISTFQKGATIVTWRATDGAGLTKTCTFRVTVNDTEAPTMTCPPTMNLSTAINTCSAVATYTNPSFTDNCAPTTGTAIRISGLMSGASFPAGNSNVVFQATDAAGNTRRCTMVVTVTDNQPPIINCPQAVVIAGTGTPCTAIAIYPNPTASDNCAGALTPFLVTGLASGSVFSAGVTTNTFRALTPNGQSADCSFTVTVNCGGGMGNIGTEDRNAAWSTEHTSDLDLTVAPNPALSTVTVSIEGVGASGGTLLVFDAVGRLALRQVIAENQQTAVFQVDGSEFALGMYRVNLRTETGMVTKTLVVVK